MPDGGQAKIRVPIRLGSTASMPWCRLRQQGLGSVRAPSWQVKTALEAGQLRRILTAYDMPPVPVQVRVSPARWAVPSTRAWADYVTAYWKDLPAFGTAGPPVAENRVGASNIASGRIRPKLSAETSYQGMNRILPGKQVSVWCGRPKTKRFQSIEFHLPLRRRMSLVVYHGEIKASQDAYSLTEVQFDGICVAKAVPTP